MCRRFWASALLVGLGALLLAAPATADNLYGNDYSNTLLGGESSSYIWAYGGNDYVEGNGGSDPVLEGNGGQDHVWGNQGDDVVMGGQGFDVGSVYYDIYCCFEAGLSGGPGNDDIWGGDGNDKLLGQEGLSDRLHGETGMDYLHDLDGGPPFSGDVVNGNEDWDYCVIDNGDETLNCEYIVLGGLGRKARVTSEQNAAMDGCFSDALSADSLEAANACATQFGFRRVAGVSPDEGHETPPKLPGPGGGARSTRG